LIRIRQPCRRTARLTVQRKRSCTIGDVAKAADVRRLFEETKKAFDRLDVLVNNAGVYKFLPLEEITEDEFHRERTAAPTCPCSKSPQG
jgi:3-oxoacyl-[acyl-carrier protein] reductase